MLSVYWQARLMFNRIERTTPLWNISPNSPWSSFASRERWKRRRNSLLQFLSHKFSSLTIIDNKVYPEIRLLQWEEIYRKPLNSGYSNNQRILFNIYMEFNDYLKSDLFSMTHPARTWFQASKMEEMTMKLWSQVWQVETGCLFKLKKILWVVRYLNMS